VTTSAAPNPRAAERENGPLELIALLTRAFATSMDLDATLRQAIQLITDHIGAEGGTLFLLEDEGRTLVCSACAGAVDITGLRLASGDGIVGRAVQENVCQLVRDVRDDPAFQGKVDASTGFTTRSILCAPMCVQDERLGAIELVNKRDGDGLFSEADRHVLEALASSAALSILNARLAARLVEQERLRRELELASEIQKSLLPTARPAPFPVHGVNVAARGVSGDFYDFLVRQDGRIAFCLGDVSGKGMNAALLMAKTVSLHRCLAKTTGEPGRLLAILNRETCETAVRGMFVTMVAGVYDPRTGMVRLANAGHEPPLHRARDGTFTAFPADAPPLGILPDAAFPEIELRLDGGALWLVTDGVTEGRVRDGGELGVEGLRALVSRLAGRPPEERLAAVVAEFTPGALHDDVTLLVLEDSAAPSGGRDAPRPPVPSPPEAPLELRFPAAAAWLPAVRAFVHAAVLRFGCNTPAAQDIVLAVDEACQNVVRYAYPAGVAGDVVLTLERAGDAVVVRLRDFAPPADRAAIRPRALDEVRPGGLGTHLMHTVMDTVDFFRPVSGEGNLLRMLKRVR
jgi:sigma-B regulation protein RsbU (phosphoserine phosphatase)